MSHAKINVSGNLGNDPETRYTPNGRMNVRLSIAVNTRQGQDRDDITTWYNVTAWGELAERLDKLSQKGSIHKGSFLEIEGYFLPRPWTDNSGNARVSYDVTAFAFDFVGGGRPNGTGNQVSAPQTDVAGNDLGADDF